MIKTFVIDHSGGESLRESFLIREPEIAVLAELGADDEALAIIEEQQPDILLLDFNALKEDTGYFLQDLVKISPKTKVILLVEQVEPDRLLPCLEMGARGYIVRTQFEFLLAKAIRLVHQGEAWVPREMVSRILDRLVAQQKSNNQKD